MNTTYSKKLRDILSKYRLFSKSLDVLDATPKHAIHWYVLLATCILIIVVGVCMAWFVFQVASKSGDASIENQQGAATISRPRLQKVLDMYELRAVEFDQLLKKAPEVIDPGR